MSSNIWDSINNSISNSNTKNESKKTKYNFINTNKSNVSNINLPKNFIPQSSGIKYTPVVKKLENYLSSNIVINQDNNQDNKRINNQDINLINLESVNYSNSTIINLSPFIWYDISDFTSLVLDSNNNVSKILDKSGNNNHIYQSNILNQPKYHNGGLLFNNNQWLNSNSTFNQSINYLTIFIVVKQYNQINSGIISGYSTDSINDYNNLNAWAFTGTDLSTYQYSFLTNSGTNGNILINSNNINKTVPFGVYEIRINNMNGSIYYNGSLVSSGTFTQLGDFTNIVLGSRYSGSNTFNNFFSGEIYETIIFNTGLIPSDRYSLEKLLLEKWNPVLISRSIPINNIYIWLDASSRNNFTLDENNNVLSWNDKNFKLNFSQSNPIYYPIFDTNKVIFNGSYLTMTDMVGLDLNNFSIFYVFEELLHINNTGLLSCINTLGDTDDQVTNGFALITSSSNTINLAINSINLDYTDITSLSKKVYEFNVNNGVGTIYINGVLQDTVSYGTLGTGLRFAIGARQNNSIFDITNPISVNIYEIIILNTSASYQQRNQIYSYLNEKWNIPCILNSPALNPKLWLDSNNNSSITIDGSNNILTWNDLSSNNYPVTINTTTPTIAPSVAPIIQSINGKNAAYFNNSNLNINFNTSGGNLTGSYSSLYLVFSASSLNTTTNNRLISFYNGTSDISTDCFNLNSGLNNGALMYNSSVNAYQTINFNDNPYILSLLKNNTTVYIYINNYLIKTLIDQINYNYETLDIGSLLGGSQYWIGYIPEIILYTTLLNHDENLGTIKYLANKWSINISSSCINEYIPRLLTNSPNYLELNGIIYDSSYLTVSDTINKSKNINMDIPISINSTLTNQLTLLSNSTYLSTVDINILYNVIQYNNNYTIVLPTLLNNSDYYAFNNVGIYTFTITGPNELNTTCSPNQTIYLTNISGTYTISSSFSGFTCTLNQYTNFSNNFILYIGGWSNTLSYINSLNIYDSNNNYIATTGPIYYLNNTYQADFSLPFLAEGTYTFIVSDLKSNSGNIISYQISTPITIINPILYINTKISGEHTLTLTTWDIYSSIKTLEVWASTNSDYSDSIYITMTNSIEYSDTYVATFNYLFSNNYYWISFKNKDPYLNLQISQPLIITDNFNFYLDNTTHTGPYNIILENWSDVFTANIPLLYVFAYEQSDFSDIPILINIINTSLITNNGMYLLPLNVKFNIDQDYYLSVCNENYFNGNFNIRLSNNINKLKITGQISPTYGFLNMNNIYTITLSNDELYDLTNHINRWFIFNKNKMLITSNILASNQELLFSFNPGFSNEDQNFYVNSEETLSSLHFNWATIDNTIRFTELSFIIKQEDSVSSQFKINLIGWNSNITINRLYIFDTGSQELLTSCNNIIGNDLDGYSSIFTYIFTQSQNYLTVSDSDDMTGLINIPLLTPLTVIPELILETNSLDINNNWGYYNTAKTFSFSLTSYHQNSIVNFLDFYSNINIYYGDNNTFNNLLSTNITNIILINNIIHFTINYIPLNPTMTTNTIYFYFGYNSNSASCVNQLNYTFYDKNTLTGSLDYYTYNCNYTLTTNLNANIPLYVYYSFDSTYTNQIYGTNVNPNGTFTLILPDIGDYYLTISNISKDSVKSINDININISIPITVNILNINLNNYPPGNLHVTIGPTENLQYSLIRVFYSNIIADSNDDLIELSESPFSVDNNIFNIDVTLLNSPIYLYFTLNLDEIPPLDSFTNSGLVSFT